MEPNLAEEHQESQPLLPSKPKNSDNLNDEATHVSLPPEDTGFTFNAGKRPYRDAIFTFLFLGTILITYGCGIVAFTRADFSLVSKLRTSRFNPGTNQCEIVEQGLVEEDPVDWAPMIFLPICALVLAFPVGVLLFWLLHRYTRGVVLVTNPFMSLVPVGLCVYWFTWCYGTTGICATALPVGVQVFYAVFFPTMAAFTVYRLWKSWSGNSFEVTVQLLKMATDALKQHLTLLVLQPVLLLGSMVLVNGPIFAFIWYAINNGKIVPNFDVVHDPSKGCDLATGYPCCQKQRPEWFTAYTTLACFTLIWVFLVSVHLQILVVSGTISQWYFAPTGSSTLGNIKRSLRIAFGPSFGTACNLGTIVTTLVVALLGLLKRVTSRVANSSGQGMISAIIRKCLSWMFQWPECHTRFAPSFATISGDSFWESSKKANILLRRNSLCTTGMDFALPTQRVLTGMTFIYAFLQSLAVYGVLEYFLNPDYFMNFLVVQFCFLGTILGLAQFSQAISSAIDTVYICYAMERDTGEISKPEICHGYMLLPKNEAIPAGRLAPEDKLNAP